MRRIENLEIVS